MRLHHQYRLTFLATLLFFVAFYALLVPLPLYLADNGLADWQVGLVLGTFGIASLLGRPWAGLACDRLGRVRVILAGIGLFVAGVIAVMLTHTLATLMLARALQALGYVAVSTGATARITDLTPAERRGAAIAQFGIAANLAMVLTPATIDAGLGWLTIDGAFWVAVGAALLSGALVLTFRDTASAHAGGGDRRLWVLPPSIRKPWIAAVLLGVGFGVWLQFLPLLTDRRDVEPAGLLYAWYGVSIIVTRLVTSSWQDRGRERVLLLLGFGSMMLGLGLFAFTATLPTYLVATTLVAAGGGIAHPLLMALHVRFMPVEMRGRAVSTFYLGFDLGNGLGVWILGFALQWWGTMALFGLAALSALAGLALSSAGRLGPVQGEKHDSGMPVQARLQPGNK